MDQEKMHGVLQKSHGHVQIVSDSGNASLLMKSPYGNNYRNSEDQARSVFLGISNHRYTVLTFLTVESDGTWRVVTVPLQYPEQRGHLLFGHINVDRLHPIFSPAINATNHNRRKAHKGPQGGGSLLMHSSTARKSIQSDARCQSHKKALPNKAEYSGCNYGLNSSTSNCDPRLLQGDPCANDSTAELTDGVKADKATSKISRNKARRKGKQRKRPPFNGGLRELEVLAEDFDHGSSISRTYGMKNEVDSEGTVPCGTGSELQLKAARVPENCADDDKSEGIDCSETPQTSISNSYGRDTSNTAAGPFVQNTHGENNGHEFKGDSHGRCAERHEDLDSSIIMPLVVPCCDNRVNKLELESNRLSACKVGSVGNSHQHAGKGTSYPVWQKVQQKHDQECVDEKKKLCSTESKIDTSWRKASLLKQNGRVAEGNMEFRTENKQQPHPEFSRKLKRKGFLDSKTESDDYSRKGSFTNKAKLEKSSASTKIRPCTNKTTVPSQVDQTEWETESKSVSQKPPRTVYSVAPILDNEDAKYEDSSLPIYCARSNHINYSELQSSASVPHLLADEISLLGKEVSVADCSKQRCSPGSFTQKWVPVRMKNPLSTDPIRSESCLGHSCDATVEDRTLLFPKDKIGSNDGNDIETGVTCRFEESRKENYPPCDDESLVETLTNEKSCMLKEQNHEVVPCSFSRDESENQKSSVVQIHLDKITRAIQEVHRIQLASEAVHLVTGGPIAEFERLLCFSSPVLCQSQVTAGCNTCPRDRVVGSLLCQHERPNVSLGCLWQWYKKHTSYGLEVRGEDYINSSRIGVDRFAFRAYFVPYLSAVQLFKKCSSGSARSINGVPRSELEVNERSEKSVFSGLPMFSLLVPQARNGVAGKFLRANKVSTCQSSPSSGNNMSSPTENEHFKDLELLFEYFEVEQPQQRQPLYDRIQELVGGCGPSRSGVYGDPSKLDSANLCDLDPRSWYSVAWYPIYRIPDGNFRAAFLTYHSLGNLICREATFDSVNVNPCVVCPVVGLQSYNCQSECWFELKPSALSQRKEVSSLDPSKILKERLRTLEEVASLMATAAVTKGGRSMVNRQPDYEFFLSRRH
ncbi:uncharacterized protein LOC115757248 isoform X2 [Rhodamnia argentea]|uniref:Uncharacterized protein LOC115757248 isoform X2 n=1 Tax=Rhodamnia argentea TaxID=178133 RepID=A0A8B8R1C4_9MYRT|nr:uncharacterized protein LOC115757248 isoform X2 [Rhodamnia argentea]